MFFGVFFVFRALARKYFGFFFPRGREQNREFPLWRVVVLLDRRLAPLIRGRGHHTSISPSSPRTLCPQLFAPTNGRPGFPFGFLGAGGCLPKARRAGVFCVQFCFFFFITKHSATHHHHRCGPFNNRFAKQRWRIQTNERGVRFGAGSVLAIAVARTAAIELGSRVLLCGFVRRSSLRVNAGSVGRRTSGKATAAASRRRRRGRRGSSPTACAHKRASAGPR